MTTSVTIRDITDAIEEFAPLSIQETWDNSGLIIGFPEAPVTGVLVGFDCTEALVEEALAVGADLIVTHHPLIYGGLTRIDPADPVGAAVIKAVKYGIAVYAAHTTADKVSEGVSRAMARRLGLEGCSVLSGSDGVGFGLVGDLPSPMPALQFVRMVKDRFFAEALRCSRPVDVPVSRVAVCGGSGSGFIPDAISAGAQAYVTADITYHRFYTRKDFMVIDIGHFESEVEVVDILMSVIKKKFPNFAVRAAGDASHLNPIYYF